MHDGFVLFGLAAATLQQAPQEEKISQGFQDKMLELQRRLKGYEDALTGVDYPFDHAQADVTLASGRHPGQLSPTSPPGERRRGRTPDST